VSLPATSRPRVVISEFIAPEGLAVLEGHVDVIADATLVGDRARLLAAMADAAAIIVRDRTQVDAELLAAAPRLRTVGRLGVGTDNLDLEALAARGVKVHLATGANAISVAEHVIGALLFLSRPSFATTARVIAGEWPRPELIGRELSGRTLGLLGFGATARAVAHRATALGMSIVTADPVVTDPGPGVTLVTTEELFAASDALSVHAPLLPSTRGLVGGAAIASMPEGALLVDTSRGGVVDHDAVVAALRSGRLAGAALDVHPVEPVDAATGARYAGVPGLLLTPHLAGVTLESNTRISHMIAHAVVAELAAS
jgi:(S)-sulfolactate dehydrogenase